MRVAYATMLYRDLLPFDALRRLHDMGVEEYEVSYDNFTLRRGQEDMLLDDLVSAVKRAGYRVLSIHLPYDKQTLEQLAQGKEGAVTRMLRWLRAGADMGARIAVIHTLPVKQRDKALDVNAQVLSRLTKEASNLGLTLAVENRLESDMFGSLPDEIIALVNRVEGLRACLDVGHLNVNSKSLADDVQRLVNYLAEVHAHDNDGYSDLHLPPMTGTIDWFRLAGALLHFQGQLTYEVSCAGSQARCDNYVRLIKIVNKSVFG
ncbi:MAG: sugar phosphate isomerase/epimerase family protein [Acidilobus sp.]